VEQGLFAGTRSHSDIAIAERVAVGFTDYARGSGLTEDLAAKAFPHPFDSHPPLVERLAALGVRVSRQDIPTRVVATSADTWFSEIGDAERIESDLWETYEARFRAAHEQSLAYRYLPSTPEERAHVERYFPSRNVPGKRKSVGLSIDCMELRYSGWKKPVAWSAIEQIVAIDEPFRGRILTFRFVGAGDRGKLKLPLRTLREKPEALQQLIGQYYGRYLAAKANPVRASVPQPPA
jgi:hypothetical protein